MRNFVKCSNTETVQKNNRQTVLWKKCNGNHSQLVIILSDNIIVSPWYSFCNWILI